MDEIIELRDIGIDKYGRLLGTIFCKGVNMNEWLLKNGWAVPYEGKGEKLAQKIDWGKKVAEYKSKHVFKTEV